MCSKLKASGDSKGSRNPWLPVLMAVTTVGIFCVGCNQSSNVIAKMTGPAPAQGLVEATFDDLKFEMEEDAEFKQSLLTPKVKELFERRIRIRGYIYPTMNKRGLKTFVLVRDNLECCFGPGAALFDCILVYMVEGKTAEFSIRPVAVEGKFSYEEFLDYDGTVRAIYRLDGESVE